MIPVLSRSQYRFLLILLILLIFLFIWWLSQRGPHLETVTRTQIMMGDVPVVISATFPPNETKMALAAIDEAFDLARSLADQLSTYRQKSSLSRLNTQLKKEAVPVPVEDPLRFLLWRSLNIANQTDGTFDPTFASSDPQINYQDLEVDMQNKQLIPHNRGIQIDLNAIAKGYIVDQLVEGLLSKGIQNFLINAGGDLRLAGQNQQGPWHIAIRQPSKESDTIHCSFDLISGALATSGTYERGKHLIDPHTRRPTTSKLSSVSVHTTDDAALADALATALFVAGEEALMMVQRYYEMEWLTGALFIFENGKSYRIGTIFPADCADKEL